MPAPRKVDRDELARLVTEGHTTPQLAKHFGVTESTIARNRAALGITTDVPRMTSERRTRIEAMLDDGQPFKEIHRTEGADMETLRRHFPGRQWTRQQARDHVAAVRPLYRQMRRAERHAALGRTYGNAA